MQHITQTTLGVELQISTFENNNCREVHLMSKPVGNGRFEEELERTVSAIENFIDKEKINQEGLFWVRFFVSDCANQISDVYQISEVLEEKHKGCAVSVVQQPPLRGSKVVAWAYIVDTPNPIIKTREKNALKVNFGGYEHVYHSQLLASDPAGKDSYQQTDEIFRQLNDDLESNDLTIKDHCIRTWIYVKDVDYNYGGVVVSRRELFEGLDMTPETHYITSTGIEGRHFDHNHSVLMDAYSIKGINTEQVKFLTAPDHLNPTHEYGVTFERGTSVDFADRRHIYLSGTASIDNKGEVVHPNEIDKQIERTLTNIEALLKDADAGLDDIAQLIIYIRDVGDMTLVNRYFDKHLTNLPKVIVLAPVCRPGWLIEMECIAIKAVDNEEYAAF